MPWRTSLGDAGHLHREHHPEQREAEPPAQSTGANCFLRACGHARQRRTSATTNPTSTAIPSSDWTALKMSYRSGVP